MRQRGHFHYPPFVSDDLRQTNVISKQDIIIRGGNQLIGLKSQTRQLTKITSPNINIVDGTVVTPSAPMSFTQLALMDPVDAATIALAELGPTLSTPETQRLIKDLLSYKWNLDRALRAAAKMAQWVEVEQVNELRKLLQESDGFVVAAVAEAVARHDGIVALPLLMRALRRCEQDGRGSDKLTILIAQLIKMYPTHASRALYQMSADHAPLIRRDAAWALGLMDEEYAETPLLHLLNDAHPSVRVAAANALKRFKTENVANALVVLMRDPEAQVRATVVIALGNIGNYYCLPALHAAINDPAEIVRTLAADALKRLGFQSPTSNATPNRGKGFKFNLFGSRN